MEALFKRKKVDLPIGGVESHAAVLRPGGWQGNRSESYSLLLDAWGGVMDVLEQRGGGLPGFCYGDSSSFTADGDQVSIEGLSADSLILEASTREVRSYVELPPVWALMDSTIRDGVRKSGHDLLVSYPGVLPLAGRRFNFDPGGSHACLSAPPAEAPSDHYVRESVAAALAALLPFIASGGLCSAGFCVSPMGAQLASDEGNGLPYQVTVKTGNLLTDPPARERRFHILMDSPYSSMGCIAFGVAQLLLTMAQMGCEPAPRLVNSSLAVKKWARDPEARCRLAQGRGLIDRYRMVALVARSMMRFTREYELPPEYDALIDLLARGAEWLAEGDEESLAAHFEYTAKRRLYERLLRDYFDICSIDDFNACARAVSLSGMPPDILMQASCKEVESYVRRAGRPRIEALKALMKERGWSPGNLRSAAAIMKKMERVELMLHERSHLEFDSGWRSFRSGFTAADPAPTRARARARLIRNARASGLDLANMQEVLGVDWANFVAIPESQEGMTELMAVCFADPGSEESSPILHIKLRDEDVGYEMGLPEFEPFVDALWLARHYKAKRKRLDDIEELNLEEYDDPDDLLEAYRNIQDQLG